MFLLHQHHDQCGSFKTEINLASEVKDVHIEPNTYGISKDPEVIAKGDFELETFAYLVALNPSSISRAVERGLQLDARSAPWT